MYCFINKCLKIFIVIFAICISTEHIEARIRYTKATKIGMIKDCEDAAQHNYEMLKEAILHKKNIKLNGTFYISFPQKIMLDYTLHITGGEMRICKGTAFDFSDGGGFHALKTTINRVNVNDAVAFIGGENKHSAINISEFYIENCTFLGRQLLQLFFEDIDGSCTQFGIGNVVVKNNYFENGGRVLILDGIIKESCVFSDNTYHEFPLTPIYICYNHSALRYPSEDGTYQFVENNIKRSCPVSIVRNKFIGKTVSTNTYYCAALVESVICNFKDNYLKDIVNYADGKELSKATCYDAYLSCSEVYFEGNTIENLISYSKNGGSKPLCEYGKSKINILRDEGYKAVRHYIRNTYIVNGEKFITDGADPHSLCVNIFGNVDKIDDYKWEDNSIILDKAYLSGRTSSSGYGCFSMVRNQFTADSIVGRGLCLLSPYSDMENVNISDNRFESKVNRPFVLFSQTYAPDIVKHSIGDILITGNTIIGTSPKICFSHGKNVLIADNVIDSVRQTSGNYYISDYSGTSIAPSIENMQVELPYVTKGGCSDICLSNDVHGSFTYRVTNITMDHKLCGTYYLTRDGEFSFGLLASSSPETTHEFIELSYHNGNLTVAGSSEILSSGWRTIIKRDGVSLKIKYSKDFKKLYFELIGDKKKNADNVTYSLMINTTSTK